MVKTLLFLANIKSISNSGICFRKLIPKHVAIKSMKQINAVMLNLAKKINRFLKRQLSVEFAYYFTISRSLTVGGNSDERQRRNP